MATRALLAKTSVVYVVAVVTINATPARGVDLRAGARMARHARDLRVCPIDDKSRFLVMIEVPYTPVAYVVTDIAGRPQLSLVRIIFAMATHALTRRVLESLRFMTVLACHLQMTSQ